MTTDGTEGVSLSNMPASIAAAVIQVKSGIAQLGFDERNEHGRYSYASVDKFYTLIRPLEAEAGLFVMLDETGCDIRDSTRTDDRGQTRITPWAFIRYDLWLGSKDGEVWGPVRRHWAGPVTGPQTFGAAESYVRKAFSRGLYEVPTGERDGDDTGARDDAPPIRVATRLPATSKLTPPPVAKVGNGQANKRPAWVEKFLSRGSYEIDPKVTGTWSKWEEFYLTVCRYATHFDQLAKLAADNGAHFSGYREAVKEDVYNHFRTKVEEEEKRLWPATNTDFVNEMSSGTGGTA